MNRILFVGSYLSGSVGSKGVCESVAERLAGKGIKVKVTSRLQNKVLRMLDIIFAIIFYKGRVVHIDVFSGQAFIIAEVASILASIRNKRIIISLRGGNLPDFFEKNELRVRKTLGRAQRVQTPSLFLKSFFETNDFKVAYLPNGVSFTNFEYKRSEVTPNTILWVRAFNPIYNPQLAIETINVIKKQIPDIHLTMIGPDNGILNEIQLLILKLKLENNISILGPINNDHLFSYYQSHAVYLNTTSYESFGVAVIEAAACGIPVVSTNVGEMPYLWAHKENILLIDDFSPTSFADTIIELLRDTELSNTISVKARKNVQEFEWGKIIPKWETLILDASK